MSSKTKAMLVEPTSWAVGQRWQIGEYGGVTCTVENDSYVAGRMKLHDDKYDGFGALHLECEAEPEYRPTKVRETGAAYRPWLEGVS